MKHNKKITYSTGDFAAYFGIKKDTLFYYDKIKLFCPAGVRDNGYRYYTASQIEPFRTLLSLRELNVPLKVLQEYFQNPSPEKLAELSARHLDQIEKEMEKLARIKNHLTYITEALQEAESADFGTVKIVTLPPVRLLYSRQMDASLETSQQQWEDVHDDFRLKFRSLGSCSIGSVISKTDLKEGNFDRIACLFAKSPDQSGTVRTGGQYALYYHKGPYNQVKLAYQNLLSQIKTMGLQPAGDAYEEYLVAETATKEEDTYVTKILIRIQKAA